MELVYIGQQVSYKEVAAAYKYHVVSRGRTGSRVAGTFYIGISGGSQTLGLGQFHQLGSLQAAWSGRGGEVERKRYAVSPAESGYHVQYGSYILIGYKSDHQMDMAGRQ